MTDTNGLEINNNRTVINGLDGNMTVVDLYDNMTDVNGTKINDVTDINGPNFDDSVTYLGDFFRGTYEKIAQLWSWETFFVFFYVGLIIIFIAFILWIKKQCKLEMRSFESQVAYSYGVHESEIQRYYTKNKENDMMMRDGTADCGVPGITFGASSHMMMCDMGVCAV